MKPIGGATGSDHRGRERVLRHSARTARNRRTRTRMYGGVGARRGNPPGDPIRRPRRFHVGLLLYVTVTLYRNEFLHIPWTRRPFGEVSWPRQNARPSLVVS